MTVQEINQMIHDAERERRGERHRLPSKRYPTRMTVKQSLRWEQW